MEKVHDMIYEKYNALKKRKLVDEVLEPKREAELKEFYDAMKEWVSDLQKEKEELYEKLGDKQDQLEKARMDYLEDIRAKDNEILRLKLLLAEKIDKNNSTATVSLNRTPEAIPENSTPILPAKKTPQSNSKAKRVRLSEKAILPCISSEEEARKQECSRRHTCISGNGANECPSLHMLHLLLESLVRLKISLNNDTERFSVSVSHEATASENFTSWRRC
ncbi:uncharacterized protein LOC133909898 isoform X2 [Phragmites australis]|uniref:uncharacterized protein LOC133909898 isoform X2 n=1 Tax=Phragmites australis TaxID=29695 RepID=UPI002D78A3A0|nr:uncharacterized protein LOC133909898 isoform X2 [Phragmites australis]